MNFVSINFLFTIGRLDLTLCMSHALKVIVLEYFNKEPIGKI